MKMRYLGRTGLQVSAIGFGTATFGGNDEYYRAHGTLAGDEARRMIDVCRGAGVNLFDTSNVYSAGLAEQILGEALGSARDDVLISTKLRYPVGEGPNDAVLSRHHIIEACEASLRRLGTDRIDLLQLHEYDAATPWEETLRALDDLVRAGKVRYLGVSNFSAWMIMKMLTVSERRGWERVISHQASYSLIERNIEYDHVPMAESEGVGHIVWGPLAGGLLTGKYHRGEPGPEGARRTQIGDLAPIDEERAYDIVDVLREIAEVHNVTPSQVAINWLLVQPTVSSVLVGARREEQLADNLASVTWELEPAEIERLTTVSAVRVPYPAWHQRNHANDRPVGVGRAVP